MKNKKLALLGIISLLLLSGCNEQVKKGENVSKTSKLKGMGHELIVNTPKVNTPLPVIKNAYKNSDKSTKYTIDNPIVNILYGFDSVWSLNNSDWQNERAKGNGPQTDAKESIFANAEIRNAKAWRENIQYCINATNNRTDEQALIAYYDAQRGHNYTVIDGLGPLAEAYKIGANATTTIDHSNDGFDVNTEITYKEKDKGNDGGTSDSKLGAIYDLVHTLRESNASTSGAKYFYSSPRPWRMNDIGEVIPVDKNGDGLTDLETIGDKTYEIYESSVKVIPALKYGRRNSFKFKSDGKTPNGGRGKDGGYPSGHTNAAYLASIAYAYAVPERFSEMFTRASEMGNNRIIAGMHSPFDVIGGRTQATAISAYAFSNPENKEIKNKAYEISGKYFGELAKEKNMSLYEYAHTNDKSAWANHDKNKAVYRARLTYGFSKTGQSGIAPIIPAGAESILETRQPYLSSEQRRAVLYTTAIDSGYPVLDESNGWGRLDYVTAADGYGAFLGDVTVNMDASKGRFNAHDWWRNDISGKGMLTKEGTGVLTLTGNNSYSGGTLIKNGTLEAESQTAFGTGAVYMEDGETLIDSNGSVLINKNFTMEDGTLYVVMDRDESQITSKGKVYINDADLKLDFSAYNLDKPIDVTLITADKISGEFKNVITNNYKVTLKYTKNSVIAHIEKN